VVKCMLKVKKVRVVRFLLSSPLINKIMTYGNSK
jgi:hypothetical protein